MSAVLARLTRPFATLALAALIGLSALAPAHAVKPDEILADATLEGRARAISAELRCMVCQNQSIDDSDAPLARDLRILVRERLTAGASDAEVKSFLVERYGQFVLLKPEFSLENAVLWLGPFAIVAIGALALIWRVARRRRRPAGRAEASLSAEEQAKLAALLSDDV